eukprot:GHVL01026545.1.p1 GENE.GHVL01026545.1~~GHVL01026545.1.p1  ORF type:complete len:410 (-),score=64.23 GHVL01026545.1:729-1958(-)
MSAGCSKHKKKRTRQVFSTLPIIGSIVSVIYFIKGKIAVAQISCVSSILGFCPLWGLWRCFAACVRCCCGSMETLPENKVYFFTGWMGNCPSISSKRIFEIALPGSHDSAAYTFPYNNGTIVSWAQTQDFSILKQLQLGIRYLDFRVRDQWKQHAIKKTKGYKKCEDRFWLSHTYLCIPLKVALNDIKEFVMSPGNENEIIIVNIKPDHVEIKKGWKGIRKQILDTLACVMIIPARNVLEYTILNLQQIQQRVLFIADVDIGPEVLPRTVLNGSWNITNSQNGRKLLKNLTNWINNNQADVLNIQKLTVLQAEVTPDTRTIVSSITASSLKGPHYQNLYEATEDAHWALWMGLTKSEYFSEALQNVVTHDFVRSDLIGLILMKNFQLEEFKLYTEKYNLEDAFDLFYLK